MPVDLDELERLEREATPGPWEPCPMRLYIFGPKLQMVADSEGGKTKDVFRLRGVGGKLPMDENLDLICKGRNALPDLLAEARTLRARVAEMERAFDLLQGWANRYDNELCPPAGYADTYGDGMRSAKQGVKTFCITTLATLRAEEGDHDE